MVNLFMKKGQIIERDKNRFWSYILDMYDRGHRIRTGNNIRTHGIRFDGDGKWSLWSDEVKDAET